VAQSRLSLLLVGRRALVGRRILVGRWILVGRRILDIPHLLVWRLLGGVLVACHHERRRWAWARPTILGQKCEIVETLPEFEGGRGSLEQIRLFDCHPVDGLVAVGPDSTGPGLRVLEEDLESTQLPVDGRVLVKCGVSTCVVHFARPRRHKGELDDAVLVGLGDDVVLVKGSGDQACDGMAYWDVGEVEDNKGTACEGQRGLRRWHGHDALRVSKTP